MLETKKQMKKIYENKFITVEINCDAQHTLVSRTIGSEPWDYTQVKQYSEYSDWMHDVVMSGKFGSSAYRAIRIYAESTLYTLEKYCLNTVKYGHIEEILYLNELQGVELTINPDYELVMPLCFRRAVFVAANRYVNELGELVPCGRYTLREFVDLSLYHELNYDENHLKSMPDVYYVDLSDNWRVERERVMTMSEREAAWRKYYNL